MNENLLQFIWQFRYFNQQGLCLDSGEPVSVLFPGRPNSDQGPDFLDAKIRIGNTTWSGHVELHVLSSDWTRHEHDHDRNYNNVILHVVWENDLKFPERNIPLLLLQERVSKLLLEKYAEWMNSRSFIACEKNSSEVSDIIWLSWKQRLLIERLQRKASVVQQYLQQNQMHWEETLWWMMAANFGMRVNAQVFEAIARSIPLRLLARHRNRIEELEALLMGQSGLLNENFCDGYALKLQKIYRFLQFKYRLRDPQQPVHFLRMRPGNFPTIRLAQLAALIHRSSRLFAMIRETQTAQEVQKLLSVTASDYWDDHYFFDKISPAGQKTLGRQMTDSILINTLAPLLYAYGSVKQEEKYISRALHWLETTAAERNQLLSQWKSIGIEAGTASDSQALLELKHCYCDEKRCLECAVGNALLLK